VQEERIRVHEELVNTWRGIGSPFLGTPGTASSCTFKVYWSTSKFLNFSKSAPFKKTIMPLII